MKHLRENLLLDLLLQISKRVHTDRNFAQIERDLLEERFVDVERLAAIGAKAAPDVTGSESDKTGNKKKIQHAIKRILK
jgi:hypothetical protein